MKLVRRLFRPLWHEDAAARRRRRLRQLVTLPAMSFAGLLWGALATPASGGTGVAWALGGAVAFGGLCWLYLNLQPALAWWTERTFDRGGRLAGAALDWGIGTAVVWSLVDLAGMPTFSAITAAIGLGGAYAAGVASFFGDGGDRLVGGALTFVRGGGTGRIAPPFSHIEAHLAAGRRDEAIRELLDFVEDHPSDARGWLHLGRLLGADPERLDDAVGFLREGIDRASPDALTRQLYVAEIVQIRRRTGEPHRAGRDLAALAEFAPEGSPTQMWARRELSRLRELSERASGR